MLSDCLRKNVTLTEIRLEYKNIGDEGDIVLEELLHHNTTLAMINLMHSCLISYSSNIIVLKYLMQLRLFFYIFDSYLFYKTIRLFYPFSVVYSHNM